MDKDKKDVKETKDSSVTHPETGPLGFITKNDAKQEPDQTIPPEVSNEVETFSDDSEENVKKENSKE